MGDDTDVWVLLSEVVDGGIDVLADDEVSRGAVGEELGEVEVVEVVVGGSEGFAAEVVTGELVVGGVLACPVGPPMMVEHPPTPLIKTHVSSKTVLICADRAGARKEVRAAELPAGSLMVFEVSSIKGCYS